jgi:hypothetical protein
VARTRYVGYLGFGFEFGLLISLDIFSRFRLLEEKCHWLQHLAMVFLGPKDAQIEVRLVKPPFEATDSDRVYIDEYEQLGTPHREKGLFECHRYIASEDTKYAIEVTLRKGFTWGDYLGIRVHIDDRARKARIGFGLIDKVGNEDVLEKDQKILLSSLFGAADGKFKTDAHLSIRALTRGELTQIFLDHS